MARARPWLIDRRHDLTRAFTPLLAMGVAWWLAMTTLPAAVWIGVTVYGAAHLALIWVERSPSATRSNAGATLGFLSVLADALFAILLISQAHTLGSAIYPLYFLIALRVLSSYRWLSVATLTPFLLGPTYLFAQHLNNHNPPLPPVTQMTEWVLLIGSLAFGVIAICNSAAQQRVNAELRHELSAERQNREVRVGELERAANDLRARMREIYTLEEGLRVITSTLSLDEVLGQIVDSTAHMLGSTRVQDLALSLDEEGVFVHRSFMSGDSTRYRWAEILTRRVIQQQVPLIIGDTALDPDLAQSMPRGTRAVLCVPLFVGDGPPRGALTVISTTVAAFTSTDTRHLTALANQAGIAIQNAEMHTRLRRQQRLLEAVIRDINDGLVVLDASSQIVLTNPIGRYLLNRSTANMPVQNQLVALAEKLRAEGKPTMSCELRLVGEEDEVESFYQAFASQAHYDDSEDPLIAIVLHDITAQKVEERTRTEFISMVSHELRNPLNSLNGFLKVVLQGRAGALTPLQHEFLEIAESQTERLKGRIAELLEFNRLDAGRLVLNPQWNDVLLLVAGTVTRLSLQAEQAGLQLINAAIDDLPECRFDSERIGQVLTNLVENAIKATPPGGSITIRSQLHENEVWVQVYDTGVGIPADEQPKIFQRFYRAHNRASSQGNHLGLGLAICQQIVEGHSGRIWVESEEGCGTCFTFALPLIEREIVVNDWPG